MVHKKEGTFKFNNLAVHTFEMIERYLKLFSKLV
jgi:hypothetical protein